jgi:hypothetical protein
LWPISGLRSESGNSITGNRNTNSSIAISYRQRRSREYGKEEKKMKMKRVKILSSLLVSAQLITPSLCMTPGDIYLSLVGRAC